MNSVHAKNQRNLIIIILWGLVFSKCLTLEYLIQIYSIPINSFVYIWTLTLAMASAATITFFRTHATKANLPKTVSIIHIVWLGCGIVSIFLIGISFLASVLNPYKIPTFLSIILGIGYLFHGILARRNTYIFSGVAWWIGAAILATRNNVESLSIFAFLLIMLTVLPLLVEIRQQNKAFTQL